MKHGFALVILVAMCVAAHAQIPGGGVGQYGAVTAGHCAEWKSAGLIEDSGGSCGGGGGTITAGSTATSGITSGNLIGSASNLVTDSGIAYSTLTGGPFLPLAGGTVTGAVVVSGASFGLSGNISSAAWTTNGVRYKNAAATLTDTSSSGTVAAAYTDVWGGNTIAASGTVTFTNYYGAYFKVPVTGSGVTFTNVYALGADSFNATTLYQGGTAIASTFAPLASPTFTGTVGAAAITATGIIRTSSAGSAAAPSLVVGNATTGLYSVSTTGLGASVNGALKLDYGITTAATLTVVGNLAVTAMTQSATAQTGTVCYNSTGGALTYDATLGCLTSLEELKDIRGPITGALAEVAQFRPFWFRPILRDPGADVAEQPGFGAHQIEAVDKRLVGYGANGELRGVRYMEMTAVLAASIHDIIDSCREAANDNFCVQLLRRVGE